MNTYIDREKRPYYLQIYRLLREEIISGAFPCNGKLPSRRLLAEETGVSTVTVEHAYELLCEEGYAEARERSGYYAVFRPADAFSVSEEMPAEQRIMGAEEQEDTGFSAPMLARAMRRVLSEQEERILQRSPNCGLLELRTALRNYLARNRGIQTEVRQIVIGSGAEYLYGQIITLLGRERIYAIESPAYEKLEQIYHATGVTLRMLPLTRDGIDSAALLSTDASVLHTTPYRSYPSGVTASASKRHEYIRWAGEKERILIESDHDAEFAVFSKPAETLCSLSDRDNVIYLNTFSKSISPAFRVAYMVLPKQLLQEYEKKLGFYSCTVPTFEQLLLTDLLNSGDFERHINRVRRRKRREAEKKI